MTHVPKVALLYERGAYTEMLNRPAGSVAGGPLGLMGRQVAGQQFLDAYLSHGIWHELTAVVDSQDAKASLLATCQQHPSSRSRQRRLRIIELNNLQAELASPDRFSVLHLPCPPDEKFAWARQQTGNHGFAISGVTHTLCSLPAIQALRQLITAPFESYDRLICTSRAVVEMVRAVTDSYADYLQDRHGGQPAVRIGIEAIPLGVNTDQFQPATPSERQSVRTRLKIDRDEIVILFVGRLAHHAKAHPFPLYRSLAEAARQTSAQLRLLLCGWAASPAVLKAFQEGAQRFAPNVSISFVDGTDSELRRDVWRAADIFTSLSDNIQETFGLVLVEAMASGLPVVATDWNGYRDLNVDGETGVSVPTCMVRDATVDSTVRLLTGEINYDHFLAECSQTVSVDVAATTRAFVELINDADLRQRMGAAGRRRVLERFDWRHVIQAYEDLWRQQEEERRLQQETSKPTTWLPQQEPSGERLGQGQQIQGRHTGQQTSAQHRQEPRSDPELDRAHDKSEGTDSTGRLPAAYPPPEHSFRGYPTSWLDDEQQVQAPRDANERVSELLSVPLLTHEAHRRCTDLPTLRNILERATPACRLADLDGHFQRAGVNRPTARATIAWLLKYDLLRSEAAPARAQAAGRDELPQMCFVTTCMGRLSHLQQSLPRMVEQPNCCCVVVDYSCPEQAGDWVERNFPQVKVVRCPGHQVFHRSAAKNAGAFAAQTPSICLIDADVLLVSEFSQRLLAMLKPGEFYRAGSIGEGTGGTMICGRQDFARVGGHDMQYQHWGEEDDDLCDALRFAGVSERAFPTTLIQHIEHGDETRMQFHATQNRQQSHLINRLYRVAKWDLARMLMKPLSSQRCGELYQLISKQLAAAVSDGDPIELIIDMGASRDWPGDVDCQRRVVYELQRHLIQER